VTEWDSACVDEGRRTMFDIEHKNHLHGVSAQCSLILVCYKKENFQNLIISTKDGFKKKNPPDSETKQNMCLFFVKFTEIYADKLRN